MQGFFHGYAMNGIDAKNRVSVPSGYREVIEVHSRRGHAGPAHGFELLPQPGGTRARGFERHIVAAPVGGGSLEDRLRVVRRQVHAEAFVPAFRPAPGSDARFQLLPISAGPPAAPRGTPHELDRVPRSW